MPNLFGEFEVFCGEYLLCLLVVKSGAWEEVLCPCDLLGLMELDLGMTFNELYPLFVWGKLCHSVALVVCR